MGVIKDMWDVVNGPGKWLLKIVFILLVACIVVGIVAYRNYTVARMVVPIAVPPVASEPAKSNENKTNNQSGDNINSSGNGITIKQERNGTINIRR